ncbi:MAG: hypothetical protein VX130_00575 [Verrucomicrobiota bacterium]|nr:hypothetical protein [Verrucomicrobiota bacterium]
MKKILKSLTPFRWFLDIRRELAFIRHQVNIHTRIRQQACRMDLTRERDAQGCPFPSRYEHQTYSQNGEDGILMEILRRLGKGSKRFVEIGSGDGLENNTRLLLELGWEGLWIDGNERNCELAKNENASFTETGTLKVKQAFVTTRNVNELLEREELARDADVLSIDLDLNTYHVWKALKEATARVIIIEYNGFFPPGCEWVAEHDPEGCWKGDIQMGASLKSLTLLAENKGYSLIGCDLSGTNAFFVPAKLAEKHFPGCGDPDKHFEPARPFLLNNPEHRTDLA